MWPGLAAGVNRVPSTTRYVVRRPRAEATTYRRTRGSEFQRSVPCNSVSAGARGGVASAGDAAPSVAASRSATTMRNRGTVTVHGAGDAARSGTDDSQLAARLTAGIKDVLNYHGKCVQTSDAPSRSDERLLTNHGSASFVASWPNALRRHPPLAFESAPVGLGSRTTFRRPDA